MTGEQTAAAAAFDRQRAAMAVDSTTAPEKVVLLVLAIMANSSAEAWPPIRGPNGLAARCSLSERTVTRALRGLETGGHISTSHVEGKGSIYAVHPCHCDTPVTATPLSERHATPVTVTPKQPRTTRGNKATPSYLIAGAKTDDRGSRLSADFAMPADWIEWAAQERGWSRRDAASEADNFRDYWIAQPGARGRKADWQATWRVWVRKSHRRTKAAPNDMPTIAAAHRAMAMIQPHDE